MKILFFTGALRVGGSEAQLINLLLNLPDSVEPVLVTLKTGQQEEKLSGLAIRHFVIGRSSRIPGLSPAIAYFRLKSLLRQEKPDAVQSHLPGTNIIAAFACRRVGIPHILMEEGLGVTRPFWERLLRKRAFRFPGRFVCNSEAIRDRMVAGEKVDPGKITLVRNAVTISGSYSRLEAREKLGIPEDCFTVLTAASLKPVKGIDHLIRGFSEFSTEYRGSSLLLIAGDGEHREEYECLAKREGGNLIRFLGVREDIPELMAASDVYVSSSLSEGLSNSIIEAMYSGLPVIATDVGGSSLLLKASNSGRLISPGEHRQISVALMSCSEDKPSPSELTDAKKYVEREFSTERVVTQFTDIYREVMHGEK